MGARVKIMIVDDDRVVLELTRLRLESVGYEVVARNESIGTAKAILQHRPDLVLLDVHMPGLSGDALANLIWRTPNMPENSIVLFSGSEPELLDRLVDECGALGWVKKTPNAHEFLANIGLLLLKKRNLAGRPRIPTPPYPSRPGSSGPPARPSGIMGLSETDAESADGTGGKRGSDG